MRSPHRMQSNGWNSARSAWMCCSFPQNKLRTWMLSSSPFFCTLKHTSTVGSQKTVLPVNPYFRCNFAVFMKQKWLHFSVSEGWHFPPRLLPIFPSVEDFLLSNANNLFPQSQYYKASAVILTCIISVKGVFPKLLKWLPSAARQLQSPLRFKISWMIQQELRKHMWRMPDYGPRASQWRVRHL